MDESDGGKDIESFANTARDFSNDLYARAGSQNLKPDIVPVALGGASALMAPEPLNDIREKAQIAFSALRDRFGLK